MLSALILKEAIIVHVTLDFLATESFAVVSTCNRMLHVYVLSIAINTSIIPDNDECALGTHNCDDHADCSNILGSYDCVCTFGYTGNGVVCNGIQADFRC